MRPDAAAPVAHPVRLPSLCALHATMAVSHPSLPFFLPHLCDLHVLYATGVGAIAVASDETHTSPYSLFLTATSMHPERRATTETFSKDTTVAKVSVSSRVQISSCCNDSLLMLQ
ncbi:hypothetical protein SORBI_3003G196500 [Sorghum bicolor]|uniref:Uncharacterized protein n=1 Tax=Sorghum bicolor TaxID=4558 RepID=A0A1B6Q4C8_SORBI|nr:hypothetical protein SORBI_3003G196500 [Sorghum bicolor]